MRAAYDLVSFYGLVIPLTAMMVSIPWSFTIVSFLPLTRPMQPITRSKFSAVKFVSLVASVTVSSLGWDTTWPLRLNVLQAVLADALKDDWMDRAISVPNVIAGCLLAYDAKRVPSPEWIFNYTIWNVAFVYGMGFSALYVFVLFVPLPFAMRDAWLPARAYSLFVVACLRWFKATRVFTPGESFLCKIQDTDDPDRRTRFVLGCVSFLSCAFVY